MSQIKIRKLKNKIKAYETFRDEHNAAGHTLQAANVQKVIDSYHELLQIAIGGSVSKICKATGKECDRSCSDECSIEFIENL